MAIATFLMFSGDRHGKAEEAIRFYTSLFRDSNIDHIARYEPGESEPEGTVKSAHFTLSGREFMAMDSAAPHQFNFTPSVSLFVTCASQDEVATLFSALSQSGQVLMPLGDYGFSKCFGWTNDRYGVSWQIMLAA